MCVTQSCSLEPHLSTANTKCKTWWTRSQQLPDLGALLLPATSTLLNDHCRPLPPSFLPKQQFFPRSDLTLFSCSQLQTRLCKSLPAPADQLLKRHTTSWHSTRTETGTPSAPRGDTRQRSKCLLRSVLLPVPSITTEHHTQSLHKDTQSVRDAGAGSPALRQAQHTECGTPPTATRGLRSTCRAVWERSNTSAY